MEEKIKIAAKLYQCRDGAKAYCKIQKEDYKKTLKPYTDIIRGVMKANKVEEIPALLEISKTKTYSDCGTTQMMFLAAVVELIEPSNNLPSL